MSSEDNESRPKTAGSRTSKAGSKEGRERPASTPNQRYYTVRLPRRNDGMHLQLHRSLTARLRRRDTQTDHDAYGPCMNILHKQRTSTRNFASQNPVSAKYMHMISERLYTNYDVRFKPAEGKGREPALVEYYTLTQKPIYTEQEVRDILKKIKSGEKDDKESKDDTPPKIPARRGYYPADLVCKIIRENTAPRSKPPAKSCRSRVFSAVPAEIARDVRSGEKRGNPDETTKRISQYDARFVPAESRGTLHPEPWQIPVTAKSKEMTEADIDNMVARLNDYDKKYWPPESKGARLKLEDKK